MSFADLVKANASFIAGHVAGEDIQYWIYPYNGLDDIKARVQRNPIDPMGEVLRNAVSVFVSKTDVPFVRLERDKVKIGEDIYRVSQVLEENVGSYLLLCMK